MASKQEQQSGMRYWSLLGLILLLVLGSALYWFLVRSALSYPFQFDDFGNVVLNRAIRHWGEWSAIYDHAQARTRPLTFLSYAWNFRESGLSVSGFRFWNIFLHWANALILALLLGRLCSKSAAVLGALCFLLHPLALENVIYISGRASLLALFFSLLSLLVLTLRIRFFWLFLLWNFTGLLALLSKESGAALVPMALLLSSLLGLSWRRVLLLQSPFIFVALALVAERWLFFTNVWKGIFLIQDSLTISGVGDRIWFTLGLWPGLLAKIVVPVGAAIDQAFLPGDPRRLEFLLGLVLLALVLVALYQWLHRRAKPWLPLLLTVAALLPTHSLLLTLDPLAERHLYPALVGLSFMAAFLWEKRFAFSRFLWLLPLAGVPVAQDRVAQWERSSTLWGAARNIYPYSFRIAYNLALNTIQETGSHGAALPDFLAFLRRSPPLRFEQWNGAVELMSLAVLQEARQSGRSWQEVLGAQDHPTIYFIGFRIQTKQAIEESARRAGFREDLDPLWKSPVLKLTNHQLLKAAQADRASANNEWALARDLWTQLFSEFAEDHSPLWPKRQLLAEALFALGKVEEAKKQYEYLAYLHKSHKQYPPNVFLPLLRIYEAQSDWQRASDVLGELLRVQIDNSDFRMRYADYLERLGRKEAQSQRARAKVFEEGRNKFPEEFEWMAP